MTTWNYRVIRETFPGHDESCLRLIEAYYDDADTIDGWCWAPPPAGETRDELVADALHMVDAADKPIIEATDLPGYPDEIGRLMGAVET